MLYLVATPLGNSEDITLRAVKTLTTSDIILCEDTRTFDGYYKKIQAVFKLKPDKPQKIIHFHKKNEYQKVSDILSYLKDGENVALVCESGMPTVSDPGSLLLKQVIKEQIPYTVIPGPTAFTNALILSGFSSEKVLFLGFLPKKQSKSLQLFNQLKCLKENFDEITIIFYESPHRIDQTLSMMNAVFPKAEICICREMTKKFEEVTHGRAKELSGKIYKGEITVVVELISKKGGER